MWKRPEAKDHILHDSGHRKHQNRYIHRRRWYVCGCQAQGAFVPWEGWLNRFRVSLGDDENVLELDGGDDFTTLKIHQETTELYTLYR